MRQTTLSFAAAPKAAKPEKKIDPEAVAASAPFSPDYEKIFDSPEDFANCLEPSWRAVLKDEFQKPYLRKLLADLRKETRQVFPKKSDILNAFKYCPFNNVKVVVIGQDPYHDVNQAHGLSFSVQRGVTIPPSLANIYQEIAEEYPGSFTPPKHGCLESWARQGLLMLNATLTVAAHEANSHSKLGWLEFTKAAVDAVNKRLDGVVFLAWGKFALGICKTIDKKKHFLLQSGHPSPLSQKYFFGCGHFKKANECLQSRGKTPINWNSINE